jgi:hypothetical protein
MSGISMMDEERFWSLIERSRALVNRALVKGGDSFQEEQIEHLSDLLHVLSPEQVVGFDMRATALSNLAYRWELWDAAYWAHGGCSDDGFMDFRDNLISLGMGDFYRVLRSPDDLAEIINGPEIPYLLGEGFGYLAGRVYREKTGRDLQEHFERYPASPEEPRGEQCDLEDEAQVKSRFPRLFARFPEMGE